MAIHTVLTSNIADAIYEEVARERKITVEELIAQFLQQIADNRLSKDDFTVITHKIQHKLGKVIPPPDLDRVRPLYKK